VRRETRTWADSSKPRSSAPGGNRVSRARWLTRLEILRAHGPTARQAVQLLEVNLLLIKLRARDKGYGRCVRAAQLARLRRGYQLVFRKRARNGLG
jgi:hypothetical protein